VRVVGFAAFGVFVEFIERVLDKLTFFFVRGRNSFFNKGEFVFAAEWAERGLFVFDAGSAMVAGVEFHVRVFI